MKMLHLIFLLLLTNIKPQDIPMKNHKEIKLHRKERDVITTKITTKLITFTIPKTTKVFQSTSKKPTTTLKPINLKPQTTISIKQSTTITTVKLIVVKKTIQSTVTTKAVTTIKMTSDKLSSPTIKVNSNFTSITILNRNLTPAVDLKLVKIVSTMHNTTIMSKITMTTHIVTSTQASTTTTIELEPYVPTAVQYFNTSRLYKCETCYCKKRLETNKTIVGAYSSLAQFFFKQNKFKKDICEIKFNCSLYPLVKFNLTKLTGGDNKTGVLVTSCGNKYFWLGKAMLMIDNLAKYCCGFGMVPALIETREELNCIYDIKTTTKDGDIASNNMYSLGFFDHTMKRDFLSCPDKIKLNDNLWSNFQPDNSVGFQCCVCIVLKGNKSQIGYDDVNCLESFNPMCQFRVSLEKPVVEVTTVENNVEGFIVPDCNNKKYLFTYKKENYVNIWDLCCSLGFLPASIEDRNDLKCLHKNFYLKSGANDNVFFTGQLDANLDRHMISCSTNKTVPTNVWFEGEPDNDLKREACVAIKFDNKTAGLIDIRCGEFANVVCEAKKPLQSYSTAIGIWYHQYIELKNVCDILKCKKSKLTNPTFSGNHNELTSQGILLTLCGSKYYLLGNQTLKNRNALNQYCCERGLELAAIRTREDLECIYDNYNNITENKIKKTRLFASSYWDQTMKREFFTCPDKLKLPEDLWAQNQPDNRNGTENCGAFILTGNKKKIGLDDVWCDSKDVYIFCQGYPNSSFVLGNTSIAPITTTPISITPISIATTSITSISIAPISIAPTSIATTSIAPISIATTSIPPISIAPISIATTSIAPISIATTSIEPISISPTVTIATSTIAIVTKAAAVQLPANITEDAIYDNILNEEK